MNVTVCAALVVLTAVTSADTPPAVTVNGYALTAPEWEFLRLTRGPDGELSSDARERLIDLAIERLLIRGFLAGRKIAPPTDLLDQQVRQLDDLVRRRGEEPEKLFAKLGLSPERVRAELALSLAWEIYVQQAASDRQIQQYFTAHRGELDGTRVRVRQVFRRAATDAPTADVQAAEQLLARLKSDIEAQRTTFEAAAKEHSQSPSAEQGGDVGWVGAPGRLPDEVTVKVLGLKPGELAGPIRTMFGLHLVQVTERQAGQLSLEDARPVILERLSAQMWRETVERERANARITRPK